MIENLNKKLYFLNDLIIFSKKILKPQKYTFVKTKNKELIKENVYSKPPVSLPILETFKKLPTLFPLTVKQSLIDYKEFYKNPLDAQSNLIKEFIPCSQNSNLKYKLIYSNIQEKSKDGKNYYMNELRLANKSFDLSEKPKTHVLLIHGYASGFGLFINNIAKICDNLINKNNKNVEFHCLDLPGHGFSSRDYDLPFKLRKHSYLDVESYFAGHIDHYITTLKDTSQFNQNDKLVIVAHSCGSYFATLLANEKNLKHKFDKLIMVSPAGLTKMKNLPKAPYYFKVLWENFNVSPLSLVRNSGIFGSLLTSGWSYKRLTFIKNKHKRDVLHKYIYSIFNQRGCGEYMLPFILKTGADPVAPLYERIFGTSEKNKIFSSKKTEWVWMFGDNDIFDVEGGYKCSSKLLEHGIKSKVIKVEKAGHHIYFDNQAKFDQIIIDELKPLL